MVKAGVIEQYAIGGAVAAIFYIEPINTNDLDIFFRFKEPSARLDILAPLYEYLSDLGYKGQGDSIDIEGWPVQFWKKQSSRPGKLPFTEQRRASCRLSTS